MYIYIFIYIYDGLDKYVDWGVNKNYNLLRNI